MSKMSPDWLCGVVVPLYKAPLPLVVSVHKVPQHHTTKCESKTKQTNELLTF